MTRSRGRARRVDRLIALAGCALFAWACADPERDRLRATTKASYDKTTGRLIELTFDANKNGRIDTWTEMDGTRPVRSRLDTDEDGRIDRWEYYDERGQLARVGFSRKNAEKPDAWAYSTPDGRISRIEVSSSGDEARIDRWERYENGVLATAEFDEDHDGRPDRRLTYRDGALVSIETAPDGAGNYTSKIAPK
jgi:hypothetical protein